MLRLPALLRRHARARATLGYDRLPLRRDIGMDDWDGSIGTSHPDRLWPDRTGSGAEGLAPAIQTRLELHAPGLGRLVMEVIRRAAALP